MTLSAFLHAFIPTRTDLEHAILFIGAEILVLMLGALIMGTFGILLGAIWDGFQGVVVKIRRRRRSSLKVVPFERCERGYAFTFKGGR